MAETAQTIGQRVYLIRLANGDGVKNPLSLADFAALVREHRGVSYDPSALSRMENGDRKVTLEDIEALAPLDPMKRGRAWLAWGDITGDLATGGPPQTNQMSGSVAASAFPSPEEEEREIEEEDQITREIIAQVTKKPTAKKAAGSTRRGHGK